MNMSELFQMLAKSGEAERSESGQVTLKYLRDVLSLMNPSIPCTFDTGHELGTEPAEYGREPAYESSFDPSWNTPEHDTASGKHAYPSCYRGYYSDCTFNASERYPRSTVGHVLELVEGAIGKTFNGYKGGLNTFGDSTLVWGGGTSHSSCGDSEMVVGVELIDGVCVLKTSRHTY